MRRCSSSSTILLLLYVSTYLKNRSIDVSVRTFRMSGCYLEYLLLLSVLDNVCCRRATMPNCCNWLAGLVATQLGKSRYIEAQYKIGTCGLYCRAYQLKSITYTFTIEPIGTLFSTYVWSRNRIWKHMYHYLNRMEAHEQFD